MSYIPRHLAPRLQAWLDQFPVVLLLGARQVGKSTFLEHELQGWRKVDLENAAELEIVSSDPTLFLTDNPQGVWFDEAQRCPELFSALRVAVDGDRRPGRYVLSGSASPYLLQDVSESLAGRAGILQLAPLSAAEAHGRPRSNFVENLLAADDARGLLEALQDRPVLEDREVVSSWIAGGFPEPWELGDSVRRSRWFDAYTRLVSERDLGELHRELRPAAVLRLLRMLAARHGQVVNQSALARDFGTSSRTMGRFLDLLEGTCLWWRLPAYHPNIGKRLVRRPKGYLADAGLVHALSHVGDLETLRASPLLGPSWVGFVLSEILRSLEQVDSAPAAHFWATHQRAEVDLVLERAGRLWPVEVKHGSRMGTRQLAGVTSFLDTFGDRAPFAVVVHRAEHVARHGERIVGVPARWVCGA